MTQDAFSLPNAIPRGTTSQLVLAPRSDVVDDCCCRRYIAGPSPNKESTTLESPEPIIEQALQSPYLVQESPSLRIRILSPAEVNMKISVAYAFTLAVAFGSALPTKELHSRDDPDFVPVTFVDAPSKSFTCGEHDIVFPSNLDQRLTANRLHHVLRDRCL